LFRKTPLQAQNDYIFQKFGGRHGPFGLPWLRLCICPPLGIFLPTPLDTVVFFGPFLPPPLAQRFRQPPSSPNGSAGIADAFFVMWCISVANLQTVLAFVSKGTVLESIVDVYHAFAKPSI